MRALLTAAALAALFYALLLVALYLRQDAMIFFPQPSTPGLKALAQRDPRVTAVDVATPDGPRLRGWLSLPPGPGPHPLILYFGGNAEEVTAMLTETSLAPEHAWLLVNYRGYGESEGHPGERALLADAETLYRWASARPDIDARRITVFGRSLGSALAVHLAAHHPVAGAALVSPFASLADLGAHHYPFFPVRPLLRHRFDAAAAAPRAQAPLLALAAGDDAIVPIEHSRRLVAAWGGPKRLVELPDGGHNGLEANPGYREALRAFFAR